MEIEKIRKPDFFIVGAPKSGTTAMYMYLKKHPEIFMPDKKEVHFFGTDFVSPRFIRDIKDYMSLFADASDEKHVGEASAWYLYSKKAANEIKQFNPFSKIIIMLRNPVDVIYSLHNWFVSKGVENIADLESALKLEHIRRQGLYLPDTDHFKEAFYYRDVVKYTEQVKRYVDVFGRENIHIIIFDDFKYDTESIYQETLRFLDVDQNFKPAFSIINPSTYRVHSKSLHKVLLSPPKTALFLSKVPLLRDLFKTIYDGLMKFNTVNDRNIDDLMDPDLRAMLKREFKSEIEKLSLLLDRDLTHWVKI